MTFRTRPRFAFLVVAIVTAASLAAVAQTPAPAPVPAAAELRAVPEASRVVSETGAASQLARESPVPAAVADFQAKGRLQLKL